jgi:putative transposase
LGRLGADRVLVTWGGSPIHRRAEVKAFVAEAGDAIHLGSLPAHAPDLNPMEWLWRHLKKVEIRNPARGDLEELHEELHLVLGRVRQKSRLFRPFFEGGGLVL